MAQGLVDVAFLSPEVGLIGGMSRSPLAGQGDAIILKTDDGGQHWRIVFRGRHARGFAWKIFPMSSGLVFAALQSEDGLYEIAKSTDGGDRWETHTVSSDNPAKVGLQGVGFLDENTGWVGGFFDGMYATRDGGIHWEFVNIPGGRINRFERTGNTLITASSSGVLRTERVAPVP